MINIDSLLTKAENNDPEAIFEISQLYKTFTIPSDGEVYVEWLKRFFETDIIKSILMELEAHDDNEMFTVCDNYNAPLFSILYYSYIVEAGIDLGLYYRNSSTVPELRIAQRAFSDAFLASRFNYIEISDENDSKIDLAFLLAELNKKINTMEEGENHNE